jgi:hypothetical protein
MAPAVADKIASPPKHKVSHPKRGLFVFLGFLDRRASFLGTDFWGSLEAVGVPFRLDWTERRLTFFTSFLTTQNKIKTRLSKG